MRRKVDAFNVCMVFDSFILRRGTGGIENPLLVGQGKQLYEGHRIGC